MPRRRMTSEEREESRMLAAARAEPVLDTHELAAIKRRCKEATLGPWDANGPMITSDATDQMLVSVERYPGWEWDAEFIASAREDIPRLLEEIERLHELLARSR